MSKDITEYISFIKYIKELIYRRQYEAMKRVNTELIQLYWEIGEEITRQQQEKGWGKSVVDVLSKELQIEFPGVQGFSARNLWLMRSFYLDYSQGEFLQPLGAEIQKPNLHPSGAEINRAILPALLIEIGWKKNVVIMQKCKDPAEREFYIKMTKRYGWTKDVLINNIENRAFEKYLTNQTNFDETVPDKYRLQAKLAVKDDYNFDFIEMGIEHSEAELETGIIKNIRAFLSEMGGDFCFIDTQYHLDVADDDYYLDLLLFHRRLRSLIAIDLKIGEFIPEYVGKMQFYLTALDETVRLPDENPSIGIIICKNKNRTRVEYTLNSANKPIGVATYSYYDALPENMKSLLPSPDEIAKIVRGFDEGELDDIMAKEKNKVEMLGKFNLT
jgi:predicted nuclease of restriction endonuclease-like (RecB) superfamily